MPQKNFEIELDDKIYEAAQKQAQKTGKPLEQILAGLLSDYAEGRTGMTTYTVQRGDTLSKIAREVYGDPHQYPVIQKANSIEDPSKIWVGQVLVIPVMAGAAPVPAPPSSSPTPTPAPQPPPTPTPAPVPQPVPAPAQPTLADYVRALPAGFRRDRAGNLQTVYQFELIGSGGGLWTVTVANGTCTVAQGQVAPSAVTIGLSGDDFIKLANGTLNTVQAYQEGRIGVRGDLNLAIKFADIFGPWAHAVQPGSAPTPAPAPYPAPAPAPEPKPEPVPQPTEPPPSGKVNPGFLNGSFDDYQPYIRDGEHKDWFEFKEYYGAHWELVIIDEPERRARLMDSETFGKFTQKYFGVGGRDYHIHGKHSQVVSSRHAFDLAFMQTVAAQPGREYTFSGSIVSFYKGTSGERADNKVFKTIGLDPTGGRKWDSPTVIWGERDGKDNEWRYPKLKAKAQTKAITIFIRLENVERDVGQTELNTVHLDNFKLE